MHLLCGTVRYLQLGKVFSFSEAMTDETSVQHDCSLWSRLSDLLERKRPDNEELSQSAVISCANLFDEILQVQLNIHIHITAADLYYF